MKTNHFRTAIQLIGLHLGTACVLSAGTSGTLRNEGLYYIGEDILDAAPIRWSVGGNVIHDNNILAGGQGLNLGNAPKEKSFALNPYIETGWTDVSPQTTLDVFARLGVIHYLDAPAFLDDTNMQSRLTGDITHRFSERLRWVSRNFISYELEPDYAFAFANNRQAAEIFFFSTNQSFGYRWTERFGTYTGVGFTRLDPGQSNQNDRDTISFSNQFRYQWVPQTTLTSDYRFQDVTAGGAAFDSQDHVVSIGVEHRFNQNSVGSAKFGVQHRTVSGNRFNNNGDFTSPNVDIGLTTQVNDQFRVRMFTRYSLEYTDTVRALNDGNLVDFGRNNTFRVGVNGDYTYSPKIIFNTGLTYIGSRFSEGVLMDRSGAVGDSPSEDLVEINIGVSYLLTDNIFTRLGYIYTYSDSDFNVRNFVRQRVSLGVQADF